MSDFFDKLGAAAQRAADRVSSEFTMASQEQKVKEAYQTIGRLYYQYAKAGKVPQGAEFSDQVAKIEVLLESINQLRRNQSVDPDKDFAD